MTRGGCGKNISEMFNFLEENLNPIANVQCDSLDRRNLLAKLDK